MKKPFYLHLRSGVWYYRLNRESGLVDRDDTSGTALDLPIEKNAENYVFDLLGAKCRRQSKASEQSFHEYASPFFIWDERPHICRVLEETGRYTERHARVQRGRLRNHVFPDPFSDLSMVAIRRVDVFDFRSRLLKKCSPAMTNKIIGVVKIILREAVIGEELDRDPTEYVRNVKSKKRERGTFTVDELRKLFPERGYGPWNDPCDYTCFYLAAVSGPRRGELLVLRWRHVHFDQRFIHIAEAWKGREIIGDTKSGRERIVSLSDRMIEKLEELMQFSLRFKQDDFLFCSDEGKRLGETWRLKRFKMALERAGLEPSGRWLTPHSFRHTINTFVMNSGHDPAKIRAVLEWMDEEIQDNYTH